IRRQRLLDVAPEEIPETVEDRPALVDLDRPLVMNPVAEKNTRPRVNSSVRQIAHEVSRQASAERLFVGVDGRDQQIRVLLPETDGFQVFLKVDRIDLVVVGGPLAEAEVLSEQIELGGGLVGP